MPANINKKELSETDIITKFILPAVKKSGWDNMTQIRQEVRLRDGKVIVRGQMAYRKKNKAADIVLYHKTSMPLAVIEAKANKHEVGKGMQQALDYAALLEVPFAFASNGDSFIFHDKTNKQALEKEIRLEDFPTPQALWEKYCQWKGYKQEHLPLITQDYYDDGTGKAPRYYQLQAINKTVEAVARGQNRILLVMATGTGKTYTAFNIIWRLWKAKAKKRILFLADRNILVDQTKSNDFQPFGTSMTKITQRTVDPAYEIHLGLYQAMTGTEEKDKAYKQVSPDFFDLIVIDECHRGSAAEDSAWREILAYFSSATQIGLTATPKETKDVSNIDYFGEPIYTYSLKQGIEDGFLAPFKVICVDLDIDSQGWRPQKNQIDNKGNIIEDRVYNQSDMDRTLVVDERTLLVAQTITNYLKTDPMAKTIVFCDDIDHADRMRRALVNLNPEKMAKNDKYVMKITGDDEQGKAQLDNFIDPKKPYPVIVTTSELMTTGVDAKTCKLVVIDQHIKSMTKFKQIIGRGTRINEHYGKLWFTIMDFKKASVLFADSDFDGEPSQASNFKPKAGRAPSPEELAGGKKPNEEEGGTDTEDGNDGTTDSTDEATDEATDEGIITDPDPDDEDDNKIRKFYISGIDVKVIAERVQYYDADGDLVTESFKDYSRKTVAKKFSSLDDFIRKWNEADRKQAIVKELTELGVIWEVLKEEAGREDLDPFDLICHVVYDQPALTRKERADNVKKRNYFTKYGEIAQQVLNSLLEKYADAGVDEIENMAVLKVAPFDKLGRPTEIVKNGFGDKESYLKAVADLELEIYKKQG